MAPGRAGRAGVRRGARPGWLGRQQAGWRAGGTVRRRDWAAWFGVGTALVAALGALIFNSVSVTATNRQIELARQGQLTDRYTAAVGQLGSDSIDVRLGGIYALERLMVDSRADQPTIVEVLAAFVRDNAGKRVIASPTPAATPDLASLAAGRPADVLAALTVLGRRDVRHDARNQTVDLSYSDLAGLNLVEVKLAGANLTNARLQGAYLNGADLSNTAWFGADLTGAHLAYANLTCAAMVGADLTRADLSWADLTRAGLEGADLTGANLDNANLTEVGYSSDTVRTGTSGTPRPTPSASTPLPRCQVL